MSSFEFMMILTSIIIALAMTEILAGFARVLKGELRIWWVHSAYVLAGFIGIQQLFWDLYSYRDRTDWFFVDLLFVFVGPCVLYYLAASLLFPTKTESGTNAHAIADLETHYWRVSRPFFAVLIPLMPLYTIASLRVDHEIFQPVDAYRIAFGLIYILLAFTRNPAIHKALAVVHFGLLGIFLAREVVVRSLTS